MAKWLKIMLIVISILLVLITAFLMVYFLWPWNSKFFKTANKEFEIPGLDTNFTAQGITNLKGTNIYLISGYMSDGGASRIYIVNGETSEYYFVTLKEDTEDYTGHAGGIEVSGSKGWLVSEGKCFSFELNDILNATNEAKIEIEGSFETQNGADFVFANNGLLWVGEFHKDGVYDTRESHHLTTNSGEINKALVFAYNIDYSKNTGVASEVPVKALSIRSLCQGITMTSKGQFIMSTSYSLPDSNLYVYDSVLDEETTATFNFNGNEIPVYFLDESVLINTINAPSMAEELVVNGDRVYILFESACKKYKLFNRKKIKNVYSIKISEIITEK